MSLIDKLVLGIAAGTLLTTAAAAQDRTSRFQATNSAKVSITQAIQTAESHGKGKAISAKFDRNDAKSFEYEVKLLTADGKIVKYKLDANTGNLQGTESEIFEGYFTRLKPQMVQAAPTSLAQAIETAEKSAGGKTIEAEVERESADRVRYEVKIVKADDSRQEVKVDGATGQITAKR